MHHTIDPVMATGFKRVGHAMADAARRETLRHFRVRGLGADNKDAAGFDPVTIADRAAEAAMCAVLAQERPDDGILGEEEGAKPGTSGLTWVLDPIDGTRGFISGTPTWGVLIAVGNNEGPQIGIIDQPFTGERFIGSSSGAEWTRGEERIALNVRKCETLASATLFTTFPEVGSISERRAFERVRDQVKLTRYGVDCYAYGLIAAGQTDLVIEAGLNSYDLQGPIAVIQAAGGIVTNWQGGPAHHGGTALAAGDARTHAAALELLKN